MNSGMIGKIDKAHRYAAERDRFSMRSFAVLVHGDNADHEVRYDEGRWSCECDFFSHHDCCAHTMALELLLGEMIGEPGRSAVALTS
jgi:hypothetical protein